MAVDDSDALAGPVHWPTLTAAEAAEEWDGLFEWVRQFVARYPSGAHLPDCWWRHSELVEALSALRDYERAAFGRRSPATFAVEWQRARRDIDQLLEFSVRRLPCAVAGRGHRPVERPTLRSAGWDEHVAADVERRRMADDKFPPRQSHLVVTDDRSSDEPDD